MAEQRERDLVLAPQQFAQVLDQTKGVINTIVGPNKSPLSDQERIVRFNPANRRFDIQQSLEAGIQQFAFAAEGEYLVLENPSQRDDDDQPKEGTSNTTPRLHYGRKVNIPGPVTRALWPGQIAVSIPGHVMRSNQYVLCRVYNADAARQHWTQGVIAPQTSAPMTGSGTGDESAAKQQQAPRRTAERQDQTHAGIDPEKLVNGQLLIMRGTDYSFYIPPTGVEVLKDDKSGRYVREANTLEALEYSILVNEKGEKRYERGPAVVFPEPNETFLTRTDSAGKETRRFRAIDLTRLQGLYLQVIADYNDDNTPTDPDARKAMGLSQKTPDHKAGEELFITGAQTAIYYPRPQLKIIRYNELEKHNAVAIPKGEGRYLLNRLTGEIRLSRGPHMLLPNPINEVVVNRILTQRQVSLWFPGNQEAAMYNQQLAQIAADFSDTSQGFVSETAIRTSRMAAREDTLGLESTRSISNYAAAPAAAASDTLRRGTQYQGPRTVTLDTKYNGAVNVSPYVGYAVQVVSKTGERKVVVGPATHLLEYDETLEVMKLSSGKPKTDARPIETVYLKITNNTVSDIVLIETQDMVKVQLTLAYRVNFEGDDTKWFAVDNYVRLLTDHIRSRLSAAIRHNTVQDFYSHATEIVRDLILGKSEDVGEGKKMRPGLLFDENNMRVFEVEVMNVQIMDPTISSMLAQSNTNALTQNIRLAEAQRTYNVTRQLEELSRATETEKAGSRAHVLKLEQERALAEIAARAAQLDAKMQETQRKIELETETQKVADVSHAADIERRRQTVSMDLGEERERQTIEVQMLKEEVAAVVGRFSAFSGPLGDVLLSLGTQQTMEKLAQASAPMTILGGPSIVDVIGKALPETMRGQFETIAKAMVTRMGTGDSQTPATGGRLTREIAEASKR
jgi:major vault protein